MVPEPKFPFACRLNARVADTRYSADSSHQPLPYEMRECLSAGEQPQRRNEVVEYTVFVQLLAVARGTYSAQVPSFQC